MIIIGKPVINHLVFYQNPLFTAYFTFSKSKLYAVWMLELKNN